MLVREIFLESLSFGPLFDDYAPTIGKEAFQDRVILDLQSKGKHVLEITPSQDETDHGFSVKVIDQYAASGYNKFDSVSEYENWFAGTLPFPTKEEIEEAMADGSGT